MIIWIASYPKSGNTWLRSLISSYFFTDDGFFDFKLLKNIPSYPSPPFFEKYPDKFDKPEATAKYWINEQERINKNNNKLIFLKTHNALCKINGCSFTDTKNSLGAVHIIRDPRNVISSISNHYQIDLDEALKFMKTPNKAIFVKKDQRYLGFNALFSWSLNNKSWSECQKFPILTIKYEDLEKETFETFKKVIEFIKKVSKLKEDFNQKKAEMAIENCNFEKLQKLEKEKGFYEAISKKNSSEKIKFFNLGNKNNYKDLLNKNLIDEMNLFYKDELKKYDYNF
tara:strand:+ start:298 stop:1149 length:852 start_codon:yes stop_codon:yes gene_type:complete